MKKVTFLDHYDSFSYNVLDWLWNGGISPTDIDHIFYDEMEKIERLLNNPGPIVIGPGPHSPDRVLSTCHLARELIGKVPMFGLCLGHQILGFTTEAKIIRAAQPWHGHPVKINTSGHCDLLSGCPETFSVACYNSLVVQLPSSKHDWQIVAVNEHKEIMAMEHTSSNAPTWGTQFHPESFMSEFGKEILQNWLKNI